jgi:hypothetical protein
MGVHRGVPLYELPPAQQFISAGLEGEVCEVVGGEPKMLLCGPNMPRMTSSKKPRMKASRPAAPVRSLGRGVRVKVCPAMGSTGPV